MTLDHEIAHVGHVELLTPEPEKSLWFFTRVMGLTENGTEGDSVYLRTWDDYEHHTVKLTAHSTSGIRRTGLRASSREALDRRVKAIEDAGLGIGRRDGDPGMPDLRVPSSCATRAPASSSRRTGRTITWTEAERAKGQAWGLKTIESFHTHGTPPVS